MEYAWPRDKIALFMEMRLGKTLVAIRWAERQRGRKLVVLPLAVAEVWVEELAMEGLSSTLLVGTAKQRASLYSKSTADWFIVNYEHLVTKEPVVFDKRWDVVILDESSRLRNPGNKTTKATIREFYYVRRKAILSGLPNPESELDFFEQFRFLYGSFLGERNWWQFRNEHYYQLQGYDWYPNKGVSRWIKKAVHDAAFVLNRKSAGLHNERLTTTRHVTLPPKIRRSYDEAEDELTMDGAETNLHIVRDTWLAQLTGGFYEKDGRDYHHTAKTDVLLELLEGELRGQPVIVWFRFNRELYGVEQLLHEHHISCVAVTGRTKRTMANLRLFRFKTRKCDVLLMQLKCGKYGLNLSVSSTAIYFGNGFSFEDRAQSVERIAHPSKTDALLTIDLVARDTIDEDILNALRDKRAKSRSFTSRIVENFHKRRRECHD
jgi:SNF2 family DNA or RNA helicase